MDQFRVAVTLAAEEGRRREPPRNPPARRTIGDAWCTLCGDAVGVAEHFPPGRAGTARNAE